MSQHRRRPARASQPKIGAPPLKDYQAQLEKLRRDAAECALIRDLATDADKRALFDRLAVHLGILASQVEQEMLNRKDGAGEPGNISNTDPTGR